MKRITKYKLEVYHKYDGDSDGLSRIGLPSEKELFENNDWNLIDELYQSISLISKGMTSSDFASKTLNELKALSDKESYYLMTRILNEE
ncbi:hypothetical protein KEM09_21665 [Carboxylicivirga mesophila]|uniref:Phage protein n=1 Tax=Carboxylicivirga mesophila TaxID=1166478 RepID=A0ABS5KG88_9BACT|nr:hypothetical protein [Carboxylicivirga mesophila]MBS2214031.1 hypothetical protein [Carboxylicivirga mesophila]